MKFPEKVKPLLGFARKSGRLFLGEKAVKASLKRGEAQLVLFATDFSEKRREFIGQWCASQQVPFFTVGTKKEYGTILGVNLCSLLVITDKKIAAKIFAYLF
mgnify:CR=1 FL=1